MPVPHERGRLLSLDSPPKLQANPGGCLKRGNSSPSTSSPKSRRPAEPSESGPTKPASRATTNQIVTNSTQEIRLLIKSANPETLRIIERVALGLDATVDYEGAANATAEVHLR